MLAGGQSLVPAAEHAPRARRRCSSTSTAPLGAIARDGRPCGSARRCARPRRARPGIPLAAQALPFVGHFVTRNRGTVGGSIAHADGARRDPLCLLALGGTVVHDARAAGRSPADDFFVTHYTTALEPDELVVETTWPERRGAVGFEEFALRARRLRAVRLRAARSRCDEGDASRRRGWASAP